MAGPRVSIISKHTFPFLHDRMAIAFHFVCNGFSVIAASVWGAATSSDRDGSRGWSRATGILFAFLSGLIYAVHVWMARWFHSRRHWSARIICLTRAGTRARRHRARRHRARTRARRIMVSMMMVMGMRWWGGAWAWAIAIGTKHVAGRYAVGTAPEFGSSASAHILWIVRTRMRFVSATGIGWLMLPSGRIQSKHVQQNGGDIRHHDEGDEHDEPRENRETADAQLVQQKGEDGHDNDLQKGAVLLPSK